MADLVTRLILDNKQFNNNIAKSKQETQQFENVSTKITGTIGKFAAGIGIAMGATEAFNKVIHSSQTMGDSWDNTINACKSAVDAFFQSLSTGNWDEFNNGILSNMKNMREFSALRDSLADAKLSMSFNTRVFESESKAKMLAEAKMMSSLEFYAGDRIAVMPVTLAMRAQTGVTGEELEDVAGIPRKIEGVLLGITIKEHEGECHISLRSKEPVNADEIAEIFGGGGHRLAAGITIKGTVEEAARLLVADTLRIDQGPIGKRLMIAVPLFAAGIALTFVDFAVIWRYFGWANQTMSCVTLWAIAVYLARRERFHWIATLPAAFMTVVCVSYLCYAKIGFGMSVEMSTLIGIASAAASLVLFLSRGKRMPELENEASC